MTNDWIGARETTVDQNTDLSTLEFSPLENTDRLPALEEGQFYALAGDAVVVLKTYDTSPSGYTYVSTYGCAAFRANWDR